MAGYTLDEWRNVNMIYDTLEHIAAYRGLGANMDRAIDLLQSTDFSKYEAGRYEVDGANVFFMIQEPELRQAEDAQFEAHRRYADIQLALTDGEIINYLPIEEVQKWQPFDEDKDIGFSNVPEKGIALPLNAGQFMILYPQDAHMPCLKGCADKTRKVVVKVKL